MIIFEDENFSGDPDRLLTLREIATTYADGRENDDKICFKPAQNSRRSWVCTLKKDHDGRHVACSTYGDNIRVCCIWLDEPFNILECIEVLDRILEKTS